MKSVTDQSKKVMLSGRIPIEIRHRLRLGKAITGMTIDQIMAEAIKAWLDGRKIPGLVVNGESENPEGHA